jgi:hypothetical protein
MTVQYTGTKAGTFLRRDYRGIINGSQASGTLVGSIMTNQTWLAFEDPGAVNFWPGPATRIQDGGGGLSDLGPVLVAVPPGCTHVEFWFLAVRQEDPDALSGALYPGNIVVTSSVDDQRIGVAPSHDLKTLPSIQSARWYALEVKVRSTPEPRWGDEWVGVKSTAPFPGIWVFSAYYRCVVPESLPFDDLL